MNDENIKNIPDNNNKPLDLIIIPTIPKTINIINNIHKLTQPCVPVGWTFHLRVFTSPTLKVFV